MMDINKKNYGTKVFVNNVNFRNSPYMFPSSVIFFIKQSFSTVLGCSRTAMRMDWMWYISLAPERL